MRVNEAAGRASYRAMDGSMPGRFETLLMRAFDGEATREEREELAAQAETEPRLAEWAELRAALLDALATAGPCDVAADVMEALDEASWAPLGDALRDAALDLPAVELPAVDLWAGIAAATVKRDEAEIASWTDADAPEIGEALRAAVNVDVDVWPGVEAAIASADVEGWAPIGADIRAAFQGIPAVDVAGAVMAAVSPEKRRGGMPRWASLWMPLAGFAAAAALLFAVRPVVEPVAEPEEFALAAINDVQIEDLSTGDDVVVQVMQFDDGGPTFIMIDEAQL